MTVTTSPRRAESTASTPLAASFLLGMLVPDDAREAVQHLMVATAPFASTGDDGSRQWDWDAPGIHVSLCVDTDGESEALFRIDPSTPVTVDGEVVRREIADPRLKTPDEWCDVYGIDILDPDGWRRRGDPSWETPISLPDFWRRCRESTVRNVHLIDYDRIAADVQAARIEAAPGSE